MPEIDFNPCSLTPQNNQLTILDPYFHIFPRKLLPLPKSNLLQIRKDFTLDEGRQISMVKIQSVCGQREQLVAALAGKKPNN